MKLSKLAVLTMSSVLLAGCATVVPVGALYTDVQLPVSNATGSVSYSKTGTSTSQSILGLVAWGDGSIRAAADNGKIVKINSIDYKADSVLGVYSKYTTIVYGEGESTAGPVVVAPTVVAPAPVVAPTAVIHKKTTTKKIDDSKLLK